MSFLWTSPPWSWPLLLVLAAGAVFLTVRFYGQSQPHPSRGLRRALVVLRATALVLLVIAVAGPLFSRFLGKDVPGQLVFLVEDSMSMALEDQGQGPNRWQQALTLADSLDRMLKDSDVEVESRFFRGNGLHELQEFNLDDAVIPDARGHGTHLDGLISRAATRLAADPVRAVVVLSDGQETLHENQARRQGLGQAALLVAGLGDPDGVADRLITDLRYPETVFQGDRIIIEATVLQRNLPVGSGGQFAVVLKNGDRILEEKTLSAAGLATRFEMDFVPEEMGLQILDLEVSPLDNESFPANNRVTLGVDVRKARSRVLVIAERPGWNVRFLRQAAGRENRLAMEVVHQNATGLVWADSLRAFDFPRTSDEWLEYDAVILAGWSGAVARLDHSLLNQAIEEGLGLLVLPDPYERRGGRLVRPASALMELLPLDLGNVTWHRGPLFVEPDSLVFEHPVFSGLDQGAAGQAFSGSPPLPAAVAGVLRPGSRSLLVGRNLGAPETVPVLTVSHPGNGRVAFFGGSRLWEMTFWELASQGINDSGADLETPFADRLLRNLLVWIADGTQESGLTLTRKRSFYQEGEAPRLSAQWRNMRGQPVAGGHLTLEVRHLGDESSLAEKGSSDPRSYAVTDYDIERGEYIFQLPAMPPGRYGVSLKTEAEQGGISPEEEMVVTSHSVEQTQVRQDARRLRQLAERGGGVYHDLNRSSGVPSLFDDLMALSWDGAREESRRRWVPTSGWPFLVTVVILLGCEWFLRRRHGLL